MSEKIVRVQFSNVIRIDDKFVVVRAKSGKAVRVPSPHDLTLKMHKDDNGEGVVECPASIVAAA